MTGPPRRGSVWRIEGEVGWECVGHRETARGRSGLAWVKGVIAEVDEKPYHVADSGVQACQLAIDLRCMRELHVQYGGGDGEELGMVTMSWQQRRDTEHSGGNRVLKRRRRARSYCEGTGVVYLRRQE